MRHPGRWAFTIGLLVAASASALEVAKHRPPLELRPIFQAIQKELRSLQRRDSLATRRLGDLEDELRAARSKITRLETQLTMLRLKVSAIETTTGRKSVEPATAPAADTEPSPGSPTGRPAPARPTPAASPAKITNEERTAKGGFITITGHVQNTSAEPLTYVVVQAKFLDRRGKTVQSASAFTKPRLIRPGGMASFKIVTRADDRIRTHKLTIRAE